MTKEQDSRGPGVLLTLSKWPEPRDVFIFRAYRAARSDLGFLREFDTHMRRFLPLHVQRWLHDNIDDSSDGFYDSRYCSRRPAKPAGYEESRDDVNRRIPRMKALVARTGPRAAASSLDALFGDWPANDRNGQGILEPMVQVTAILERQVHDLKNRAANPLYWLRDCLSLVLCAVVYPAHVLGVNVSGILARLLLHTATPPDHGV